MASERSDKTSVEELSDEKFSELESGSTLDRSVVSSDDLKSVEEKDEKKVEKRKNILTELVGLNQGNFYQRFGKEDTAERRTHEKIRRVSEVIPKSDPRKALMILYSKELERFAREVQQYQESHKDQSPLQHAAFIHQKAIEHKIPQIASLFKSIVSDLKKHTQNK